MKKYTYPLGLLIAIGLSQTACNTTTDTKVAQAEPIPNHLQSTNQQMADLNTKSIIPNSIPTASLAMNTIDKNKMMHALDGAIGKTTRWKNDLTGVSYTVTPVKKIVIKDNPYCREYTVTIRKGDQVNDKMGVACVSKEGTWESVG